MALDSANNQLYIPAYGNGGFRAFQLDADGLPEDRQADFITSRKSIFGRRSVPLPNAREATFPGAAAIFDSSTERLFTIDRFANRILVYDATDNQLAEFPAAELVIGQPDTTSARRGLGPNRMGGITNAVLDEKNQRLFVADVPNNRVMIFDVHPDRLTHDPSAYDVIGQDDFESRDACIGPGKLTRPTSLAYDPVHERLFVSDRGNNRVLIFDADPENPDGFDAAIAVMGQADFASREPRQSLDEFKAESIAYDWTNQHLFVSEDLEHRIMVYDAHPDRVGGQTRALAVIGQPDAFSTQPAVSDTRVAMPRITVDSAREKLYISEGYPAGNRITVWDISSGNLRTGMAALDVIGHETADGAADFFNRMPQGHIDGRSLAAARAVTFDSVDHRLFVSDEYNHRVVVWQLDELNRIDSYEAQWVLGQPDLNSSLMGAPDAHNLTVPIGAAYDTSTKRLFVGDGYHNRIMVYDAAPGQLESGMAASVVIGQPDFKTVTRTAGRAGINFGVRMGRGIASNFLPMGFAVDEAGQRLFVSDGENHRVLIYDIRRDVLHNGAEAIGVIGQPDFGSNTPGTDARGLNDPGHLAFDPVNERLFVVDAKHKRVVAFDVNADRFENNPAAVAVIGKPNFQTPPPQGPGGGPFAAPPSRPPSISGQSFVAPNGVAHDPHKQLLYVADGGGTFRIPADRILVFDVDPDRLENGATAVATLGAPDAEAPAARTWGGADPVPGQFRVRDTRGIALDHTNGRLFATGSFESRVVQFNFPRATWKYRIDPAGLQSFATLDAADFGARSDEKSVSVAHLTTTSTALPGGVVIYSASEQTVDQSTERHSRRLISEAAVTPSPLSRRATIFVDGDPQRKHTLYIYNPGSRDSELVLSLRGAQGRVLQQWERTVAPGEQRALQIESLGAPVPQNATLTITTRTPVAITALRESANGRNETILAPAPMMLDADSPARTTLPYFVNGGGQRSGLVLINPGDEPATGNVTFHDSAGQRRPLGTASDELRYEIPPHSSWSMESDGVGTVVQQGYAVIAPGTGAVPHAAAMIEHYQDDIWTNESSATGVATTLARFAVDLRPTLIRHGEIDTLLVLVNSGTNSPATARVSLAGQEIAVSTLDPGTQTVLSIRELAGAAAHGVVTVNSETAIVVAARQTTLNIRAESIETELPAVAANAFIPYVPNGGGLSTEFRLSNLSENTADGALEFLLPSGDPASGTILR